MSSFGVLSTGFSIKDLEELLKEIEDAQKTNISAGINTTSTSVLGQLNGIYADQLEELWQVAQAIYSSQYPDTASGASLDLLVGITGLTRLPSAKSATNLVLNLDAGVTVPSGSTVSSSTTGVKFVTTADATNAGAEPSNITVASKADVTGPLVANPRSIDTIDSPITGWDSSVSILTANTQPFSILNGDTLLVKVDGGLAQTVTFLTGDTTAALVASRIASELTDATAAASGGFSTAVSIEPDSKDPGNSIEVTGGTAAPALGLPAGIFQGFNPSTTAAFVDSQTAGTVNLTTLGTLTVIVDDAAPQTVTFQAGDFAAPATATPIEISRRITTDLSSPSASAVITPSGLLTRLRSDNNLSTSSIQVTGGTANAFIDFPVTKELGVNIDLSSTGRDAENDTELRARRVKALATPGAGTLAAIRTGVLTVAGVSDASALENITLVTDSNGLPGKSFEIIVQGGVDQDIRDNILLKKPAGIMAFGTVPGTAVDSEGNSFSISFSRPVTIDLVIDITLDIIPSVYPDDGDTQVINAMISQIDKLGVGDDVITLPVGCAPLDIAGVKNVTVFKIAEAPGPATSNPGVLPLEARELARLLTVNVTITKTTFIDQ